MSVKAKEFYRWLLIESHMDSKIARKNIPLSKSLKTLRFANPMGLEIYWMHPLRLSPNISKLSGPT